jgi:hypothetical protein
VIPVPNPPFADWPVQHFDPLVGFYWYVRPAVLVSQSRVSHGSTEVIDRRNDIVDYVLDRRAPEITEAGGLFFFGDWRSVKTYDKAARAHQRERMQARATGYARRTIIVIEPESRLLRMAIEAANLFSRIEVTTDIALALSRARLATPGLEETFP